MLFMNAAIELKENSGDLADQILTSAYNFEKA